MYTYGSGTKATALQCAKTQFLQEKSPTITLLQVEWVSSEVELLTLPQSAVAYNMQ